MASSSFGLFFVKLVNATAPAAAAAAAGGDVQHALRVSAKAVISVQILGNVASLVALIMPIFTYVIPVIKSNGVGERTIHNFLSGYGSATLMLLFDLSSQHRDTFSIIVNCVAIAAQLAYVVVYLVYAKDEVLDYAWRLVAIAAFITFSVLIIIVPMVLVTHIWSVKMLGIAASTFATGNFLAGILDIVQLVKNQRSVFNLWQLGADLQAACVWTAYGFLFYPVNLYVVIPNIAGVAVNVLQVTFHTVLLAKERNKRAPAANQTV